MGMLNTIRSFIRKQQALRVIRKKKNSKELSPKDVICAVPWMHLAFEPDGKIVPCCLTSPYNYYAGDLTTEPIEKIWNSDNMKLLRKEMMEGREPNICSTCFNQERVTGESSRIFHNNDFKSVLKNIPIITEADGTCNKMELKYWDFRFSNLCNMKCRSCGPRFSSAWVPDAKKLGWISNQEKVWNIESVNNMSNFDFLKDQVKHVERVYFAGGEPLIMPEHWQILDMLIENKRTDTYISYNTNASTLTYGKKNALDYWKLWKPGKVEVWTSIDEIGERAELLRSGTVWHKVEDNLKQMAALDNIVVRPGITVGAWNVFRLPEIIEHLVNIGVITSKHNHQNFFINLLQFPEHYHVSILPDHFRKTTLGKLKTFIKEFNAKHKTSIDNRFTHIIHELEKPHSMKNRLKFIVISNSIDKVREENIFNMIPELQILKELK